MFEIILMGEPMAMFKADYAGKLEEVDRFTRSLAGAEVNVAIGLKRLGFEAAYVTKLGMDPFGKYIKNTLNAEGINTRYIAYDPDHPTGFQLKSKTDAGDPEVVYFRKGSAASHMGISEIDSIDMGIVRAVHVTGILPALSESCRAATFKLIHNARETGLPVTFDPNLRPILWKSRDEMISVINELASMCDIILPGIKEGQTLTGFDDAESIADFYMKLGVKTVIIKAGAEGAYVRTGTEAFTVHGF
jgi:2-dehydro-3-deoxygluconokinase